MIDIRETETELLLYIPASQKERAKAIDGRRWDPERRCWVYPKSPRAYDALIAEFGDDLVALSVMRPAAPMPAQTASSQATAQLAVENRELRDELAHIRATLERLGSLEEGRTGGEVAALQATVAARESELHELRRRLQESDNQAQQARQDAELAQAEAARLQAINHALEADAARGAGETDGRRAFAQSLKELAKYTAGNCPPFTQLVDGLKLSDDSLPVVLGRELERELRRRLNVEDRVMNLHDLLAQARDSDLLTPEGIDLAHSIRKQRNVMAHPDSTDQRTFQARRLLSLYAAALLWPELVGDRDSDA